jgi:DEAD/DEAH box helicase domain-containing protein
MKSIAQLLLMCDQRDIGLSIDTGTGEAPTSAKASAGDADAHVFLYDNYPGGIGFSAPLFRMHDALLAQAQQLIASCPCEVGCPSCVGPVGDIGPRAKRVALDLLARLQSSASGPAADEVPF